MKNRKAVEDSIYLDHNASGGNVHIDLHRERKTFAIHTLAYKREVFLTAMSRSCNGHKKPRKQSFSFFATEMPFYPSVPHSRPRTEKIPGGIKGWGKSLFVGDRFSLDINMTWQHNMHWCPLFYLGLNWKEKFRDFESPCKWQHHDITTQAQNLNWLVFTCQK